MYDADSLSDVCWLMMIAELTTTTVGSSNASTAEPVDAPGSLHLACASAATNDLSSGADHARRVLIASERCTTERRRPSSTRDC